MRYAIFSDIHGNLQAWNAIWADMVALEADVLVCLGDVVGYGPLPEQVLSSIRGVTQNFVLGNHDAAAVGILDASLFNEHAESVIRWTSAQLSEDSKKFLLDVPLAIDADEILFVHAEITEPGRFGYIENTQIAEENFASSKQFVTFVGHTHHPEVYDQGEDGGVRQLADHDLRLESSHRYIINVGSVGEPRNPGDIRARYVIYDSDTRQVFFRRVDFDPEAYRRDLAATSLSVSPYFLQVIDHHAAVETEERRAMMMDMQVPASLPTYQNKTATRSLLLPNAGTVAGTKPKPVPKQIYQRPSNLPMIIGIVSVVLLVGILAFLLMRPADAPGDEITTSQGGSPKEPAMDLEKKETEDPKGTPVKATANDPKPGTGLEPIIDPQPEPVAVVDPVPIPVPDPGPNPIPIPEPKPKRELQTVAYWRMDRDSSGDSLVDSEAKHPLKQLTKFRPIAALAPDPVPSSGRKNSSALTLGVWIDDGPSPDFALSPKSSFTFEGWMMTDKTNKPILIGGNQNGDGPGWRLDAVAAKSADARGALRFLHSGGTRQVSVQTTDIVLFEPDPHHFAIVWHHDGVDADTGQLQLFFDGAKVAEKELPHSDIATGQADPFRLGDSNNPAAVALDEVRFCANALEPHEFLSLGKTPLSTEQLAFMIDAGPASSLYDGFDSPAHSEGVIPKDHATWIAADPEGADGSATRKVRIANGKLYPIPLEIGFGMSHRDGSTGNIDWSQPIEEAVPAGDRESSLFGLALMDSAQDPDGEATVGIRVRGLEPGEYIVYFSPLVADELGEKIRFGIGVDFAADTVQVTSRESPGIQKFEYIGESATDRDDTWERDKNYFKHKVTITDPQDYIVALVSSGEASTAIPYLQIVKKLE